MKRYVATVASTDHYVLGEGPSWDPLRRRLLWVDIQAGQVFEGRLIDGCSITPTSIHDFAGTVGAVVAAADGRLLVAEQETLTVITPSGERIPGVRVVPAGTASRINDAKCDPAGRLVVGTLALDDRKTSERLCQVRSGATVPIDTDLTLSNGLGWSPSGESFYSIDTAAGTVWTRPYDALTGDWGRREPLLHIVDGHPDGMCVDADGNLWVAIWGRGEVRRYSLTGRLLAVVAVDAPHTSSVAFVGDDLDVLMITTARDGLSDEQQIRYPDSGRVFLADVENTGVPVAYWSG